MSKERDETLAKIRAEYPTPLISKETQQVWNEADLEIERWEIIAKHPQLWLDHLSHRKQQLEYLLFGYHEMRATKEDKQELVELGKQIKEYTKLHSLKEVPVNKPTFFEGRPECPIMENSVTILLKAGIPLPVSREIKLS